MQSKFSCGNLGQRTERFLFLILLVSYAYFFPRWGDWGQNSRFDLVLAIVEERTLSIDSYYTNTGDYALYQGKHYSDKAPGTSFLGVPVYLLFKLAVDNPLSRNVLERAASNDAFEQTLRQGGSGLQSSKLYLNAALALITLLTVALPSAGLGVLLYRLSAMATPSEVPRLALALIYGLGTSAFPYAQTFASHQIVAFLLFLSFYLLFTGKAKGLTPKWLVLIGFLLAYAVVSEYPAILIAGILGLYAIYVLRRKLHIAWMLLGAAPALLLLAVYNYSIFATPLPVGYLYSPLWTDVHSIGFLSLTSPKLEGLIGLTVGSFRGLFFVSPFLLLAIPGFVNLVRRPVIRAEFLVCAGATISLIMFNASSAMWHGGYAVGPRYLVAMLPFLTLPVAFALPTVWSLRWGRFLVVALAMWSIAVIWAETIGGQSFPDYTPNPLINYSLPRLLSGDIARNVGMLLTLKAWYSLLPLGAFIIASLILHHERRQPYARDDNPTSTHSQRILDHESTELK